MRANSFVSEGPIAVVTLALLSCSSTDNTLGAGVSRSERSSATLTPSVSAEFAIDPTPRGTSDYDARDVAVAGGNSLFLSVWTHHSDGEIRAARLGLDGTLLDPQGVHVAWTGSGATPRVVYDGSQFVVIWLDRRNPGSRLMAVRIASSGLVSPEQEVTTMPSSRTLGEPASDGTKVLVPIGTGTGIGLGVLFQPGVGNGNEVTIVTDNPSGLTAGSAAFDGTDYVVAYRTPAVQIARISPAGTGTGSLISLGLSATSAPRIEANGSNVAVLSENAGSLSFTVPSSPPVTRAVPLATEATNFDNRNFDLAWSAGGFWIGYSQIRFGQTHRIAVDTTGTVTLPDVTLPLGEGPFRGIATSETQTLLVTGNSGSASSGVIQGRFVSRSQPFPVTAKPEVQTVPGIAANDSAFFAVWNQEPDASGRPTVLRGGRVRFDGTVLDPGGIPLALPGTNTSPLSVPSVGSDGHDFLVAYNDARRATVIPVSGQGVIGMAKPLEPLDVTGSNPSIVRLSFDGMNYLAVWEEGGAVVTPAGDTVSTFSYVTRDDAGVAFNGTHHLLAWIEVTNPGVSPSELGIFATRISTTGAVLDAPLSIPLRTTGAVVGGMNLVGNGTGWLATWGESASQGASKATVGRVINGDLTLGASRVFSELEFSSAVTTSGTTHWFSFAREAGESSDLFGNRAALDGTLLDGTGFAISADMDRESVGALAFGGGRVLVGYLRSSVPPAVPTGTQVRFRVLGNASGGSGGSGGASGAGGSAGIAGSGGSGALGGEGCSSGTGDGGDSGSAGEAADAGEGGSPGTGGSSGGGGGSTTGGSGGGSGGAGRGGSAGSSASAGLGGGGGEGAASGASGSGSNPPPDDDQGCGCRTTPSRPSSSHTLAGVFLVLGALLRRRSHSRKTSHLRR